MSLRLKILVKDVILLVGLILMIAAALSGLRRQRQHVDASLNEYAALHSVEIAEAKLVAFNQAVRSGSMTDPASVADVRGALSALNDYNGALGQYKFKFPPEITSDMQLHASAATESLLTETYQLVVLLDPSENPGAAPRGSAAPDVAAVSASVGHALGELTNLLLTCNDFVHRTQLASDADLQSSTISVASIAGAMVVLAVAMSFWQYRKIVLPLQRLRAWCRTAASGNMSVSYQPTREREFVELGRDVNKMAEDLGAFHHQLEAMVALKSRELVRSERLASVGYLAAGVAHEINNPLSILSGYAELSLKRLRRVPADCVDAEVVKHLSIIRGEAFRCKEITQKLLSLSRGSGDVREIVSLADAVTEVSKLVSGLKIFQTRKLVIDLDPQDRLFIQANLTEMKQVLLNLVINAMEAVPERAGVVVVEGRRTPDRVEVSVSDNGQGMSQETMGRIFEPFFTTKRSSAEPGTGLGLSITHAIVTQHGGVIDVRSDGPNRGSRFTIRFPHAGAMASPTDPSQAAPIAKSVVEIVPEPVA